MNFISVFLNMKCEPNQIHCYISEWKINSFDLLCFYQSASRFYDSIFRASINRSKLTFRKKSVNIWNTQNDCQRNGLTIGPSKWDVITIAVDCSISDFKPHKSIQQFQREKKIVDKIRQITVNVNVSFNVLCSWMCLNCGVIVVIRTLKLTLNPVEFVLLFSFVCYLT